MSEPNFHQRASDVRSRLPLGFIGDLIRSHDARTITGINQSPQAKQVTTQTVPSSVDATTAYTVTVNGVTASFTTGAATTQDQLGAGLEAALLAKAGVRSVAIASYNSGTNVLTLTGVYPGVSFTVTNNAASTTNDLGTPTTSTSAASAAVVEFGLAVATDGYVTDEGNLKVFVPTTASFSAQVITATFAGNTGSYYSGTVHVNGKAYSWGGVVWTSDLDTTCGLIATAINTVLPAETVIAASVGSSSGQVTLTAEVEGAEFEAEAHAMGHADAEATLAYTTGPSISTSLKRALAGISIRRLDVENQTVDGDDPAYGANEGVEAVTRGDIIVERDTSETWAINDEVYVSLASATKGQFYNSAGTDRVWIPSSVLRIRRQEPSTSTDGIGIVGINLGA